MKHRRGCFILKTRWELGVASLQSAAVIDAPLHSYHRRGCWGIAPKAPAPWPATGGFHGFGSFSETGPTGFSAVEGQDVRTKTDAPVKSIRNAFIAVAAGAELRKHHHPGRAPACSKEAGWNWTAARPACGFLHRPPSHRKGGRRTEQQRRESCACRDHKKASAACKLAEAEKSEADRLISWSPGWRGSRGHPAGCGHPGPPFRDRSRRWSGKARSRKA